MNILMGNFRGFPTTKTNRHKVEAINRITKDIDAVVITEAASTKN